ncbi:FMN reductase [Flexivirga endophytica]|uniref:FMN reductase n=1 Tax=Flexivirga endophytica TaxID=1849103 RepID=A0A916X161_9MICO|nr:NAD(P)H-dependent oxidoreductase [Flexivirga endophytica]GGB45988.1 FMN reductase [Flexivirga endophytica]GHB66060.1 FMN reductase [Flexivirga endophytica]
MTTKLAVLVGSPRSASIHRRLADVAAGLAPEGTEVEIVDYLDTLPFYNEDQDIEPAPEAVQRLRTQLGEADAALLLSPANNGTLSAVLKNAIDWASRPYGQSSLSGKPVAVSSAAHNTSTVVEHTHLAVTIAGGLPLADASATFALAELDGVDLSTHQPVGTALQATVDALVHAAAAATAAA